MWADSHCHIPYEGVGEDAIEEARQAGVGRLITVGTNAEHSRSAIATAGSHDGVWATVGVHPHDATDGLGGIEDLVAQPRVVAIGECGLDYHYDLSPRPVQREVFAAQVALAHSSGLTLVIHTREAWEDTFAILDAEGVPEKTVFHCFTGGPGEARRGLDLGAYLSFSGIVTFKAAPEVREAAALCPAERLLVETDSPYLAPVPFRGRTNRPAYLPHVGAGVAVARGVPVEAIEETTWRSTAEAFGLPVAETAQ